VNGLWVNFLRVIEWLMARLDRDGLSIRLAAEKAEASFMDKFWRGQEGWFLDTAEPDDASLRPNQILAMGLPFSPMSIAESDRALEACLGQLWTPRGLRTLSPRSSGFRARFEGGMADRDSAYHQGTVWPWLTGSLIAAVLRVRGDAVLARSLLQTQMGALHEQGFFGVAEVYDAVAPHRPGGCPWQAWSAAELLRAHGLLAQHESLRRHP
jgi:glycogen debranching enzyme